jgi:hypothetical protein
MSIPNTNFDKVARINVDQRINDWLKMNASLPVSESNKPNTGGFY